jgi:tRNA (cytidine/uridine-2'-O-)-methyltransferase
MNIVLYEPEIPQNTGNIARTCAALGVPLHLIKPLGFSIDDKHLKRAGLDYWHLLDIHIYQSWEHFITQKQDADLFFASTKGDNYYHKIKYPQNSYFVFGPETRGIPEKILKDNWDHVIKIPMIKDARSLNLSNAVAIVIYEAFRQIDFQGIL